MPESPFVPLHNPTALDPSTRLMVTAPEAAELCGVSESSWHRLVASGRTPSPRRLTNGLVRFSVAELRLWVDLGCPRREQFEALRAE